MEPATTIRLSAIDNIVGVKEASANYEQITKILHGTRPGFRVWSGNDSDTLPILAMGGYGIVSVAAHLTGLQIREMIDRHLSGDAQGAAAIHRQLQPLITALFVVANPIPLKWMLNQVGFRVGRPRLPLIEPDAATAASLSTVLANYEIDLPVAAGVA
jgi:4-hydroxy-tetrahydrodipicolinate synthase